MDLLDYSIQFSGSALLLLNKIYLRKQKSISWPLGMLGVLIVSIPIYQKELWINIGYHAGLTALLAYGWFLALADPKIMSLFWKLLLKIVIIGLTFIFCIYLAKEARSSIYFTELQLGQSIAGLFAALLLAFNKPRTNTIGWCCFIVAHIFAIIVTYQKELYIITVFQVLSIPIALLAITDKAKQTPLDVIT